MTPSRHEGTLCALLSTDGVSAEGLERTDVEWPQLLALARRECLKPVLYESLTHHSERMLVPADVLADLRQAYYAAAANHLVFTSELQRVLLALADGPGVPIPSVLLKGAALSLSLYRKPGLRFMRDADLLIPSGQLEAARQQLVALGFAEVAPQLGAAVGRWSCLHLPSLRGGEKANLTVELHATLVGVEGRRFAPDMEWFWSQVEPLAPRAMTSFPGLSDSAVQHIYVLKPTANLLYLCAHLALQHGITSAPLRWFYDIHLLLTQQRHRVDWEDLVQRARAFHWEEAVVTALQETRLRFGTALPDWVLEALSQRLDSTTAQLVRRRSKPQTDFSAVLASLALIPRSAQLQLTVGILFPTPTYVRWRYRPNPAWLWPLYYPYRWFDGVRDAIKTVRAGRRPLSSG